MNTFKVKDESWHYKYFVKYYSEYMLPKDFCQYWRWFMYATFMYMMTVLLILGGLAFLYLLIMVFVEMPYILGFVLLFVIGFFAVDRISKYVSNIDEKEAKEPGFIKTKYLSVKHKFCPAIEFVDKNEQ